jgi:DNA-nicking Smr family endonuclease
VSDSDSDFLDAMNDVAPLPERHVRRVTVAGKEAPPTPSASQLERREAALGKRKPGADPNPLTLEEVPQLQPRELLEWKKDGVQHEVFARLKNAKYPIEGSLDLHGLTVKEARTAVWRLFSQAESRRWRMLLIAHGRGEKSQTPARLKSYLAHWLGQMPQVLAYHSADRRHGGTGAVFVLLKKSARAKEETRETYGLKSDQDAQEPTP